MLIQSTGFVYMYGLQFVADTLEKKSKSKVELKNINKSSQIHWIKKIFQKSKYKYMWLLFIIISIIVI